MTNTQPAPSGAALGATGELPESVTWRIPVSTPTWEKPKESIYISLLGAQIRIVQGKKYHTRVIEAGVNNPEPLILIHGVGGSAEAWYRNITNLAKDFHVCAIDALFHGLSSKESDIEDATAAQVDHVLDFMDAMGFEKAHMEGESMGSMIFFRLAYEHPERVMRLVMNTGHQVVFSRTDFAPPWKSIESLAVLTRAAMANPSFRNIQVRMEWLMATPDRVIDELVELRQKFYSLPEAKGGLGRMNVMGNPAAVRRFTEEEVGQLKVPTMVFWSEYNPGAGPDQGEYLASLIPGAKFYNLLDAAHWPQYEHPETHDAVVTKFLKTGEV